MKSNVLTCGLCLAAITACANIQSNENMNVSVNGNSTDDQKFAYMLGTQFGTQNFTMVPRQVGEHLDEDALVQAIRDNVKSNKDSSFKVQMSVDSLQAVGVRYSAIANERRTKATPDSTAMFAMGGDQMKVYAYMDSVMQSLPVAPEVPVTGAPVKIDSKSSENRKFSYMIGMQFGNQFVAIGNQFDTEFDVNYFVKGVHDAAAKTRDTTYTFALPEDSLKAVAERYNEKMKSIREEALKKQREEEEKLKAEISTLRGDTLANGMPVKMNYEVKATGISLKAENLTTFAGKPLLVFYFSATCGHCAHAAPQILAMAQENKAKGLTTIAIASGGNNKSGIRKFMDNAKFDESITVLWDESRQFGELYSDGYVPKVYLVNPDGTYKMYAAFEKEKENLVKEIGEVLSGKKVEWKPLSAAEEQALEEAAQKKAEEPKPAPAPKKSK